MQIGLPLSRSRDASMFTSKTRLTAIGTGAIGSKTCLAAFQDFSAAGPMSQVHQKPSVNTKLREPTMVSEVLELSWILKCLLLINVLLQVFLMKKLF
jgi:hypothetical protein